jgi:hypothetical protein
VDAGPLQSSGRDIVCNVLSSDNRARLR